MGIGEEIIALGGPGLVGSIQLVQVTARGRVQQIHLTAILLLFTNSEISKSKMNSSMNNIRHLNSILYKLSQ